MDHKWVTNNQKELAINSNKQQESTHVVKEADFTFIPAFARVHLGATLFVGFDAFHKESLVPLYPESKMCFSYYWIDQLAMYDMKVGMHLRDGTNFKENEAFTR